MLRHIQTFFMLTRIFQLKGNPVFMPDGETPGAVYEIKNAARQLQ